MPIKINITENANIKINMKILGTSSLLNINREPPNCRRPIQIEKMARVLVKYLSGIFIFLTSNVRIYRTFCAASALKVPVQ